MGLSLGIMLAILKLKLHESLVHQRPKREPCPVKTPEAVDSTYMVILCGLFSREARTQTMTAYY